MSMEIPSEYENIDFQGKIKKERKGKKNLSKLKLKEEDRPKDKKPKPLKIKSIKELEPESEPELEIVEPKTIETVPTKTQEAIIIKSEKIINIEQLDPKELEGALESLSVKALTETLQKFTSYLHDLSQNLSADTLKQEILRISSVKNAIDQMMPFNWNDNSDVKCNTLYAQILDLDKAYYQFKYEYDNLPPSTDESLEKIARNVQIEIPKAEDEKLEPGKNEQKEIPKWEDLIDQWIEGKICEEMQKRHIDRQSAEENLKAKFKEKLPNIFRDVAVHKAPWSWQETDLDGRVCLGLLGLAGWRTDRGAKVTFLNPNARLANKVHMDVGGYDGVAFLEQTDSGLKLLELFDEEGIKNKNKGKRFFANLGIIIDHHPDGAPSAAGMVFRLLDKFRMFENNKNIGKNDMQMISRMVEFINLTDSRGYQEIGKPENWSKSDRTILGLHRFMGFSELLKFFREDGGYNRELTDEELKKYNLIEEVTDNGKKKIINRQEQQRKIIDISNEKLKEFEQNGLIIETKFGKTIIDVKGELPGGAFVAQSIGASYIKWNEKGKTLFAFSGKELDKDLFDVGFRVRNHLWLIPENTKETGLTLSGIIEKINGKVIPGSELEKYLNPRGEK